MVAQCRWGHRQYLEECLLFKRLRAIPSHTPRGPGTGGPYLEVHGRSKYPK